MRRAYDDWSCGDLAAVRTLYADDITADAGLLWPSGGEIAGVDAIIAAFSSILEAFETCEVVPQEFIEDGETLVVPTHWRGTLPGSGGVIDQLVVATYTFGDDDRVHRIAYYESVAEAMGAVAAERAETSSA